MTKAERRIADATPKSVQQIKEELLALHATRKAARPTLLETLAQAARDFIPQCRTEYNGETVFDALMFREALESFIITAVVEGGYGTVAEGKVATLLMQDVGLIKEGDLQPKFDGLFVTT